MARGGILIWLEDRTTGPDANELYALREIVIPATSLGTGAALRQWLSNALGHGNEGAPKLLLAKFLPGKREWKEVAPDAKPPKVTQPQGGNKKKNKAKNKARASAAVSLLKHGDLLAVQFKTLGTAPVWTR